jgi:DNA-binding response OmpR family regulator
MFPSFTPTRSKSRQVVGRAIVALNDGPQTQMVERVLRRLGWAAVRAANADEVRERLKEAPGSVVILAPELADESGWLTCAKLSQPVPSARVLIVGPNTPRNRMMARCAGAAALLSDPVEVAEWV